MFSLVFVGLDARLFAWLCCFGGFDFVVCVFDDDFGFDVLIVVYLSLISLFLVCY